MSHFIFHKFEVVNRTFFISDRTSYAFPILFKSDGLKELINLTMDRFSLIKLQLVRRFDNKTHDINFETNNCYVSEKPLHNNTRKPSKQRSRQYSEIQSI